MFDKIQMIPMMKRSFQTTAHRDWTTKKNKNTHNFIGGRQKRKNNHIFNHYCFILFFTMHLCSPTHQHTPNSIISVIEAKLH